jgi:hypothetical protein
MLSKKFCSETVVLFPYFAAMLKSQEGFGEVYNVFNYKKSKTIITVATFDA